jgi:hypothetical protein
MQPIREFSTTMYAERPPTGAGSHGSLPVGLVEPHSAESGDEEVDGEDEAVVGLEGEVASFIVLFDWHLLRCFDQEVVELSRAAKIC